MKNTIKTNVENRKKNESQANKERYRVNIVALNADPTDPEKQIAVARQCVRSVLRKIESVSDSDTVDRIRTNLFDDLVNVALIRFYELTKGQAVIDLEKTITIERHGHIIHKVGETPKVKTVESSILREMLHAVRSAIVAEKTALDSKNINYISLDDPDVDPDLLLSTPSLYDIHDPYSVEKSTDILTDLQLTPTEKKCVEYALKGDSKKTIAMRLNIKAPTVYRHFEHIAAKMLNTDLYSYLLKRGISYHLAQRLTPTVHVPFTPFIPYNDIDTIFTPTAKCTPIPTEYKTVAEKLTDIIYTFDPTPFTFATKCASILDPVDPDPVDPVDPVDPDPFDYIQTLKGSYWIKTR